MELRVYAGTTGDPIAGDRQGDYSAQQARVEADFIAGVRLAVDEPRGEIRGFVPADRGSQEAFVAAMSVPDGEPLDTSAFVRAVRDLFEGVDGWRIRTGTPEGCLFEALGSEPADSREPRLPVAPVRGGEQVRAAAPNLTTAADELGAVRASLADTGIPRKYIISLSRTVEHTDVDLFVHVSGDYEGVQALDDGGTAV